MIITGKMVFKICAILGIISSILTVLLNLLGIISSTSLTTPLLMIVILGWALLFIK